MTVGEADSHRYKHRLGIIELVSLGVGGTVGSGIFVVPGLAAAVAGPSALWIWVFVAFSAFCNLLCLMWANARFPGTGAFYSIFQPLFGDRIATIIVILYLISTIFGISTIAAGLGLYLHYLGFSSVIFLEMAIIGVFCILNMGGIYLSGMTENVLTALKVIPLFLIALSLLPRVSLSNLLPLPPLAPATVVQAILLIYWPFTGFEISAIPADEIPDERLIGRSLVFVMIIVVTLYLLLNFSLMGALGSTVLAQSPAPLAAAAELLIPMAGTIVGVIGVIAMMSALNAYLVGGSRVLQNLAHVHAFGQIKELNRWGTPTLALLLCAGLSAGLLSMSNRFGDLAAVSVITTLVPYFFIGAASFLIFSHIKYRIISIISMTITAVILIFSTLYYF